MERFDDFHDELDERGRREKLSAPSPLAHGELAEKVFVNLSEGIALDVHRDGVERPQQRHEDAAVEPREGLRKHVLEFLVFLLDGLHGFVDLLTDVRSLWEIEKCLKPRRLRQEHDALRLVVRLPDLASSSAGLLKLGLRVRELGVGEAQEDQPQDRG